LTGLVKTSDNPDDDGTVEDPDDTTVEDANDDAPDDGTVEGPEDPPTIDDLHAFCPMEDSATAYMLTRPVSVTTALPLSKWIIGSTSS